jgi:hypothetical protein
MMVQNATSIVHMGLGNMVKGGPILPAGPGVGKGKPPYRRQESTMALGGGRIGGVGS